MARRARTTIDRDELRRWLEARCRELEPARASAPPSPEPCGEPMGQVIELDVLELEVVSWDELFHGFAASGLAFLSERPAAEVPAEPAPPKKSRAA
jgi:hypothetical protein